MVLSCPAFVPCYTLEYLWGCARLNRSSWRIRQKTWCATAQIPDPVEEWQRAAGAEGQAVPFPLLLFGEQLSRMQPSLSASGPPQNLGNFCISGSGAAPRCDVGPALLWLIEAAWQRAELSKDECTKQRLIYWEQLSQETALIQRSFFLNVVHCFSQTEGKVSRLEKKEVKDGTQNRGNTYGLHLHPSHSRSEAPFTAALGQGGDELLEAELLHHSSWHEQVTRAGASTPRPALGLLWEAGTEAVGARFGGSFSPAGELSGGCLQQGQGSLLAPLSSSSLLPAVPQKAAPL